MNSAGQTNGDVLRCEGAEQLDHGPDEPSLQEVVGHYFRGRNRWLNAMAFMWTCVSLSVAIFAAFQFFQAESTMAMIAWATGFLWFSLWVAMLKVWFWMEMQKLPVMHKLARLESEIAKLSARLAQQK